MIHQFFALKICFSEERVRAAEPSGNVLTDAADTREPEGLL
jgi:hypothetical protein